MIDFCRAIGSFILVFLAPGYLAVCCLRFSKLPFFCSWAARIILSFVFSFWLIFLPGLYLARSHRLNSQSAILTICVELLMLSLMYFRLRRKYSPYAVVSQRESLPNIWLIMALLLVGAFHLREIQLTAAVRGGFFYFSEAKYFIQNQGIPEQVMHFGLPIVPQVDTFGYDIMASFYLLLGPENPILLNQVGYGGGIILGAIAAFEFFVLFSPALFAALAVILTYANTFIGGVITTRSVFIPESISLIFLFISTYLFFFGSLRKQLPHLRNELLPYQALLTALALSAAALQHLEVAVLGPLLFGSFSLIHLVLVRSWKYTWLFLRTGVYTALLFGLSYLVLGALPAFVGAQSQEEYQPYHGFDPTWEYQRLGHWETEPRPFGSGPSFTTFQELLRETILAHGPAFQSPLFTAIVSFVLLFLLILAIKKCFATTQSGGEKNAAILSVALISVACIIVLLSWWTDQTQEVFVYQTEVLRRISPYLSLLLLCFLFLAPLALREQGTSLRTGGGPFPTFLFGFFLTVGTAICFYQSFPRGNGLGTPFPLSAEGKDLLSWLSRKELPAESAVLSNLVTNGAFHVLGSRTAILEGHQPVLRPQLLQETLEKIDSARSFFRDPISMKSLLSDWKIGLVIYASDWKNDLAGIPVLPGLEPLGGTEHALDQLLCFERQFGKLLAYSVCDKGEEKSP